MDLFKVIVTPRAKKQLENLPKNKRLKAQRKLLILKKAPYLGKKLRRELKGVRAVRVWPYRILYQIKGNVVWVVSILHRQGAYK